MSSVLNELAEVLVSGNEVAAPAALVSMPVADVSRTFDELSDALLDYLSAVEAGGSVSEVVPERKPADNDTYSGFGFTFEVGVTGGGQHTVTALMIGVKELFQRVCRYTAQKARFIPVAVGREQSATTNVDLYAFSADEQELYRQFLREGANMLWGVVAGYVRDLPLRGYLFDEGVTISEQSADAVGSDEWPAGSFVKVSGAIYKALKDVPEDIEITDTEYWKEVSLLYDTAGRVVFFIDITNAVKSNSLLRLLKNVEDFLYAFVLWRWYVLCGVTAEAQVWNATMEANYSGVKGALVMMQGDKVLRRACPW
jgi:hypothetical protein